MTRTSKTDLMLAQSLRELMGEMPIEKITIRSITERCGLNRQTFYYHFKDIYDLLKWIYLRDIEEALCKSYKVHEAEGWSTGVRIFLEAMDKDRDFHKAIYNSENYYPRLRREYAELVMKNLKPVFTKRFRELDYDERYCEFLMRMYTLVLFEYVERRALDTAFSSDDLFIESWTRSLNEQYIGALAMREQEAAV